MCFRLQRRPIRVGAGCQGADRKVIVMRMDLCLTDGFVHDDGQPRCIGCGEPISADNERGLCRPCDPEQDVIKECGCGLRYTRAQWETLEYVGKHPDPVEPLELRNCICGSTIAVDWEETDADVSTV